MTEKREIDGDYERLILELAKEKADREIPNDTLGHAVIFFRELAGSSEKCIKIFTGSLSGQFYFGVRKAIDEAASRLKEKEAIKILVCSRKPASREQIDRLAEKHEGIIVVKEAKDFHPGKDSHFFVSDAKGYRVERPHTEAELQAGRIPAIGNFNDPQKAKMFDVVFDHLWEEA